MENPVIRVLHSRQTVSNSFVMGAHIKNASLSCNMLVFCNSRLTKTMFSTASLKRTCNLSSCRNINKRKFTSPVPSQREIKIFGVETSCDDTSAAIINDKGDILSEFTMNQFHLHEPMGGIVPNLALRSHTINLPTVLATTLEKANLSLTDIDVFAFTRGPGIPSCLSVGTNATKSLAACLRKPLVGVHHMEAHALTVRMGQTPKAEFPYVAFLLSGGHTLVIIVHSVNHYTQLATTLDESIGEAYDKVARALGIPWNPVPSVKNLELAPGSGGGPGPALEKVALTGDKMKYKFTIPLNFNRQKVNPGLSFTGMRTQIEKTVQKLFLNALPEEKPQIVADVAASFQYTAIKHLEYKLRLALEKCHELGVSPTALVASGGVASNLSIRKMLNEVATEKGMPLRCPPVRLCTDNGAMIAWAGWERYRLGLVDPVTINFLPNWPLEDLKDMYSSPSVVDTTYPFPR